MQKITPFLWFDDNAEEAMNFYVSIFPNSKIANINRYKDDIPGSGVTGMKGKVLTGVFELAGQQFMTLDGGPTFKFTPSISFFVSCETEEEIDKLWAALSEDGETLMPFQKYPFSDKFGWTNDRFGVSWQLILAGTKQKITPFLMFVGEQHGNAEEAMNFYTSLFKNSSISRVERFQAGGMGAEGTVQHAAFSLGGQAFMAMDSNEDHAFTFTPATSFFVNCKSQEEVDALWHKLTEGGEEQPCGWLKDKYGVSWQIIPTALPELLNDPDPEKSQRVMDAMLQMKKIDIDALEQAYHQS